jgi:hypothetical protein
MSERVNIDELDLTNDQKRRLGYILLYEDVCVTNTLAYGFSLQVSLITDRSVFSYKSFYVGLLGQLLLLYGSLCIGKYFQFENYYYASYIPFIPAFYGLYDIVFNRKYNNRCNYVEDISNKTMLMVESKNQLMRKLREKDFDNLDEDITNVEQAMEPLKRRDANYDNVIELDKQSQTRRSLSFGVLCGMIPALITGTTLVLYYAFNK